MTERDGSSKIVPSRPVISSLCSTEVSDARHAPYELQERFQHVEGRSEEAGGIGRPREESKTSALALRAGIRTRAGACVLSATDLVPCPNRTMSALYESTILHERLATGGNRARDSSMQKLRASIHRIGAISIGFPAGPATALPAPAQFFSTHPATPAFSAPSQPAPSHRPHRARC